MILRCRIIAIMLGRLGMTVDECIQAYKDVAQQAFTPKKHKILPVSPTGFYSAQALESAIKKTVRTFCTEPTCVASRQRGSPTAEICSHSDGLQFRDTTCTKTYVQRGLGTIEF